MLWHPKLLTGLEVRDSPLPGPAGNTLQACDSTTSLHSLFQCLATLSQKNFSLIFLLKPNMNIPWHNLRLFYVAVAFYLGEGISSFLLQPPVRQKTTVGRSFLSLLFSDTSQSFCDISGRMLHSGKLM